MELKLLDQQDSSLLVHRSFSAYMYQQRDLSLVKALPNLQALLANLMLLQFIICIFLCFIYIIAHHDSLLLLLFGHDYYYLLLL